MIGPGVSLGAGVVDGDVEAAESGDRLVDQILHVRLMPDVGANELGLRPKRFKFRGQRLTSIVVAARDNEIGAVFREGQRGGAADAGESASNEHNRTGQRSSPLIGMQSGLRHVLDDCRGRSCPIRAGRFKAG